MPKQQGFIIPVVLSLTVFLGVVVGALIYIKYPFQNKNFPKNNLFPKISPSKNITNGPKDYLDDKLNFQFQYQPNLSVQRDGEQAFNKRGGGDFRKNFTGYVGYQPAKVLGAVAVLDKDQNYDTNPFGVWVFENLGNLSLDNWFEKYWYYPFLWGVFDYISKSHVTPDTLATISGQLTKYKIVAYQTASPKYIYLTGGQKIYLLRVIGQPGEKILATFKLTQPKDVNGFGKGGCQVAGCSNQLCVGEDEKNIITTCIYSQEFACYKNARCEKQADGKCGWTKTDELTKCLQEKRATNPTLPQ